MKKKWLPGILALILVCSISAVPALAASFPRQMTCRETGGSWKYSKSGKTMTITAEDSTGSLDAWLDPLLTSKDASRQSIMLAMHTAPSIVLALTDEVRSGQLTAVACENAAETEAFSFQTSGGRVTRAGHAVRFVDGTTSQETLTYSYDAQGRLTGIRASSKEDGMFGNRSANYKFTYAGNALQKCEISGSSTATVNFTGDASGRVTRAAFSSKEKGRSTSNNTMTFAYDADGFPKQISQSGDSSRTIGLSCGKDGSVRSVTETLNGRSYHYTIG